VYGPRASTGAAASTADAWLAGDVVLVVAFALL
jgi:hypothetical protein